MLIDPIPRKDTSGKTIEEAPCGGKAKGKAHTLAESGQFHPITWMIVHPADTGNCTIRLAAGSDFSKYVTLNPVDNSADGNGWFPCGRKELYSESKTIMFPDHFTCDDCTLQWIWKTYTGSFYQCSEIQVKPSNLLSCLSKCLNGGVCQDGSCVCKLGYTGQFCEQKIENEEESVNIVGYLVTFLVFVIVCSLLATIVFFFFKPERIPLRLREILEKNCPWFFRKQGMLDQRQDSEPADIDAPVVKRERMVIQVGS